MRIPEVVRSSVDGIPTFSVDAPRPFTAMLQFRVGSFDERLPMRGITHLIEHLALFAQRETEIAFNGTVAPHLTSFWAQGHPAEVGEFLREAARSIHDLPLERLEVESDVLQREEAMAGGSHLERILWAYFGPFGPGTGSGQPGLSWLEPDLIKTWARRYFTLDNSALVVFGDPPTSWNIELPRGKPIHYVIPERTRRAPDRPTLFDTQEFGVTWASLLKDRKGTLEPELPIADSTLARRLEARLRHELGRTYTVHQGFQRLDEHHLVIFHGFDADPAQSRAVAEEHQQVLEEFIAEGPTRDEMDRYVRVQTKALEDHPVDFARYWASEKAEAHLQGWNLEVDFADWMEACRSTTSEEIRARFEEANRQSYTISDLPETKLGPLRDTLDISSEPLTGPEWRVRTYKIPPGHPKAIRIGPDGMSLGWADGWMLESVDQIAMVSFVDGRMTVDGSATAIDVDLKRYRKTRRGGPQWQGSELSTLEKAARHLLPDDVILPPPRKPSFSSE